MTTTLESPVSTRQPFGATCRARTGLRQVEHRPAVERALRAVANGELDRGADRRDREGWDHGAGDLRCGADGRVGASPGSDGAVDGQGQVVELHGPDTQPAKAAGRHAPRHVDRGAGRGIPVPEQQRTIARSGLGGGPGDDEHRLGAVGVVDEALHAAHEPPVAVEVGGAAVVRAVGTGDESGRRSRQALAPQEARRDLGPLRLVARDPDRQCGRERRQPVREAERRVAAEDRSPAGHEPLGGAPAPAEGDRHGVRGRIPLVEQRDCDVAHAAALVAGDDRGVV